jgi:multisubunit Na+/H+ antiporter MnhF subunit
VNVWLAAATVLLGSLVLLVPVLVRAPRIDALVALECAGIVTSIVLVLLAEGFHRAIYANVALVLAALSLIGSVAFARFMERDL